jgi:hypothetical protein
MSKRKRHRRRVPEHRDLHLDELSGILERAKRGPLGAADLAALTAAVETLAFLTRELEAKGTSIERLRRLLFGASTEKTSQVVGDAAGVADEAAGAGDAASAAAHAKPKAPGHGRNGAAAYRGAARVVVPHESLHRGDACPACQQGEVYPLEQPEVLIRVRGVAPLQATLYACDRLRCNACGEVFSAAALAGVGSEKYDETAASMIGLLRYGTGLPFNRIAKLERGFGIPLPPATQWEVVARAAGLLAPAHEELIRQAAQGEVLHNDDTKGRILEHGSVAEPADEEDAAADKGADERTGVYTSGIVSVRHGHRIALFFTGQRHAGENLETVLKQRAAELPPPIQMSDLLSHNTAGDFTTIEAGCLCHSRRRYVEVAESFPGECRHVLETLRDVYKHDALAKKQQRSPEERLRFHQQHSGPLMGDLEQWLDDQLKQK